MAVINGFKPNKKFNELSAKWMAESIKLNEAKSEELRLRTAVIEEVFKEGVPKGTNNVLLDEGWVMKVQGKINVKVEASAVDATRFLIEEAIKEGKVTGFNFDDVIVYKPTLSEAAFNALTDEQKKYVRNCLSESPGTPSLEFTKPKRAPK